MFRAIILLFSFLLVSISSQAEKRALIIAIGDYPAQGNWPDVSSGNDVLHIESALIKIGFSRNSIDYILDRNATKVGIVEALRKLASKTKLDDIVYIHYSGHGQQIFDDNGDEIDNLDEAIVPYDSPMLYEPGVYEGENLLRDDEIRILTSAIRQKCGKNGQVIFVMDSCHSGTGTRGMGMSRGTDKIMAPENFKPNRLIVEQTAGLIQDDEGNMAPMASYYGASPRELNFETLDDQSKPVGSLSFAFSQVLSKMENNYTLSELFERVKMKMRSMAPRQNPQWEGPEDVMLFGGFATINNRNYTVTSILTNGTATINVGTLEEIYPGTLVKLVNDNLRISIDGEVVHANLIDSQIKYKGKLKTDEYYKVEIVQKSYNPIKVRIQSSISDESPWKKITNQILENPLVEKVEFNGDLILSDCDDNGLQLSTKEGDIINQEIYNIQNESKLKSNVLDLVRVYAQGQYLKELEVDNKRHQFDVEIVMVDCKSQKIKSIIDSQYSDLPVGSCIQFKISNTGVKGAYFSLIDIQPDNVVNIIAPATDLGYTAEEYYLKPDESYTTNYAIEVAQPLGQETLKLISSTTPIDLSMIIKTKGKMSRGRSVNNPLEKLFSISFGEINTRGMKVRQSKDKKIGVKTLHYTIVNSN